MARSSHRCRVLVITVMVVAVATLVSLVKADYDKIAGYTPVSDVIEHSELDLDMQEIEENADLQTEVGFSAAWAAYSEGGNSEKTDSIRTIRGFSTDAEAVLGGEPWYVIYKDYWNEPTYADLFTTAACNGTGDFDGAEMVTRSEACTKGAQYQNVWMYVIHELEDAINDCEANELDANDGGPHAWDEAWAFWSGSLEGEDGTGDGVMGYALAENRCEQFATCTGDDDGDDATGTSAVNHDLLELYDEGQDKLLAGECDDVENIKEAIVNLMTVPLVQGLLRYFYLADPEVGIGSDKEAAELWAFSAAILPRIHECDEDVAAIIRDNTDITSTDAPISDGYASLKAELEKVYSCMGITCSQVGGLLESETELSYYEGFEPCSDGSGSGAEGWEIAIGVIAALLVVGVAVFVCIRCRRKRAGAAASSSDLGGFDKGVSTL